MILGVITQYSVFRSAIILITYVYWVHILVCNCLQNMLLIFLYGGECSNNRASKKIRCQYTLHSTLLWYLSDNQSLLPLKIFNTQKVYPVFYAIRNVFICEKMTKANKNDTCFPHFCKFCDTQKNPQIYGVVSNFWDRGA